jgi:hypothetical protein
VFDAPVPISGTRHWSFTVKRGGVPCVRYTDTATGDALDLEVEHDGAIVAAAGVAGGAFTVTCPDGDRHTTDDLASVLTCGEPRAYKVPGVTTVRTSGTTLGLAIPLRDPPTGRDVEVPLFTCASP